MKLLEVVGTKIRNNLTGREYEYLGVGDLAVTLEIFNDLFGDVEPVTLEQILPELRDLGDVPAS